MEVLNMIAAIMAILLALLVARAYLPHVSLTGGEPVDNLARAFVIASTVYFTRTLHWDVIYVLQGNHASNPELNLAINVAIMVAEYFALKARYLTIPAEDRGRYNVFTAAWYPKDFKIRFTRGRR